MNRGQACAPRVEPVGARSCATGAARLRKMNTDPADHHRGRMTEPEKTVLRRATPVTQERAPTGPTS